jgi:hypothetical protein
VHGSSTAGAQLRCRIHRADPDAGSLDADRPAALVAHAWRLRESMAHRSMGRAKAHSRGRIPAGGMHPRAARMMAQRGVWDVWKHDVLVGAISRSRSADPARTIDGPAGG